MADIYFNYLQSGTTIVEGQEVNTYKQMLRDSVDSEKTLQSLLFFTENGVTEKTSIKIIKDTNAQGQTEYKIVSSVVSQTPTVYHTLTEPVLYIFVPAQSRLTPNEDVDPVYFRNVTTEFPQGCYTYEALNGKVIIPSQMDEENSKYYPPFTAHKITLEESFFAEQGKVSLLIYYQDLEESYDILNFGIETLPPEGANVQDPDNPDNPNDSDNNQPTQPISDEGTMYGFDYQYSYDNENYYPLNKYPIYLYNGNGGANSGFERHIYIKTQMENVNISRESVSPEVQDGETPWYILQKDGVAQAREAPIIDDEDDTNEEPTTDPRETPTQEEQEHNTEPITKPDNIFHFYVKVNSNNDSIERTLKARITGPYGQNIIKLFDIYIVQTDLSEHGGNLPEPPEDPTSVSIIDRNEGTLVADSEALFKFGQANIYSTLDAKDNTLFLGNYSTQYNIKELFLQIQQKLAIARDEDELIGEEELDTTDCNWTVSSDTTKYNPQTALSSQQKRFFKCGETYQLGLVFILKNGYRTPVYYVGEWNPSSNPTHSKRPIYKVTINDINTILSLYNENNIIGIVPVYAINNDHNVLCQGFVSPTISFEKRKTEEGLDAQYSWFYRDGRLDTLNNYSIDGYVPNSTPYLIEVTNMFEDSDLRYALSTNPSAAGSYNDDSWYTLNAGQVPRLNQEIEIQALDGWLHLTQEDSGNEDNTSNLEPAQWHINRRILTLNTPETEVDESLTQSQLASCLVQSLYFHTITDYINALSLEVSSKYSYSSALSSQVSGITQRAVEGYFWKGFVYGLTSLAASNGQGPYWISEDVSDEGVLKASGKSSNYSLFRVYPWQRQIIGGEGQDSYLNKRLLNYCYASASRVDYPEIRLNGNVSTLIYRDFDTASIAKVPIGNSYSLYQGNVDYLYAPEYKYGVWTNLLLKHNNQNGDRYTGQFIGYSYEEDDSSPIAGIRFTLHPYYFRSPMLRHGENEERAGIDQWGFSKDPIPIQYKTAPHIVLGFSNDVTLPSNTDHTILTVAELYNEQEYNNIGSNNKELQLRQWIPCGPTVGLVDSWGLLKSKIEITFKEGDYFFGRFDSLRTYAFTNEDVNSVIEVVSGMLCSRVNLDLRCDKNRGTNLTTISPLNFNLFNPVYNQLNNYFTYQYVDVNDITYDRDFHNTIQWTLTKHFGNEIDEWCNIQDVNTMDLDGDKGSLTSLNRLGNNLIAFQESGISQIQFNEKTQIATNIGTPIEISNSGKVNGKFYLYTGVGCQHQRTIDSTQTALFFIDEVNKAIYALQTEGALMDITSTNGMRSWALGNIDDKWWTYYDRVSQEVLFTNNKESLAYHSIYNNFDAFLGYGNIRWNFKLNDFTVQIMPPAFKQILQTRPVYYDSFARKEYKTYKHNESINTLWKKNSVDDTVLFGQKYPMEVELVCSPDGISDMTFAVLEYRADCFGQYEEYLPYNSFTTTRIWDEYQDTDYKLLKYTAGSSFNMKEIPLRKKFRIWRIQTPRVFNGRNKYEYINYNGRDGVNAQGQEYDYVPNVDFTSSYNSRDRVRNPWCHIYLELDTANTKEYINRFILHDLIVQYYKH